MAGVTADDDRDITVHSLDGESNKSFWTEARLLLRDLIFALMVAALVLVFVVQPVKVEGTSMLPHLRDGERIFVNKLIYYGLPELKRGDIVVFWYPDDPSKSYIKRIIGVPGDTVEIRNGRVLVNNREIEEPQLDPGLNLAREFMRPVVIKNHYYFVMGDNRDHSSDSRRWGLVPEKYIYGKAVVRYWPLERIKVLPTEKAYHIVPGTNGPMNFQVKDTDDEER